jgi:hypothetical protein
MAGLEPGGVAVKHRGLWSPRREFESLPGYYETPVYIKRENR